MILEGDLIGEVKTVLDDETVGSFRTMMRESLAEGGPIARTYLRFLVECIDVRRTEDDRREVRITARKGNAMAPHVRGDQSRARKQNPAGVRDPRRGSHLHRR